MTTDKNNAAPDPHPAELAEQQGVWPFVESPGEFTVRLREAIASFHHSNLLGAVRHVLIEKPPTLAATGKQVDPAWSLHDRVEFALRDAGFDLDEASRIALQVDGKQQQVGEVQGDALAALESAMPYLETLHSIVGGEARASVWRCIERGRAALAARQPVCGTCAEVIQPDGLTGTTCSCARQPQAGKYDQSAEDRFEQFVQAEIARSPDALRELGEYLGRVLDEDEFPQANSLLLQLATEYAAPPAQGIDLGQRIPAELEPVVSALKRFDECAEDTGSEGCDIGRDWFDALTTMGLLKRTQRSPAVWSMTQEGEKLLALIDQRDAAPGVGNG